MFTLQQGDFKCQEGLELVGLRLGLRLWPFVGLVVSIRLGTSQEAWKGIARIEAGFKRGRGERDT